MPAKVNPTQAEAMLMVAIQVIASDVAVVEGTKLNQAKLTENIDRSVMMVTALSPIIALAAAVRGCPAGLLDHVNYDAADDDACVMVAERVR